jgi:hypothetical protein
MEEYFGLEGKQTDITGPALTKEGFILPACFLVESGQKKQVP